MMMLKTCLTKSQILPKLSNVGHTNCAYNNKNAVLRMKNSSRPTTRPKFSKCMGRNEEATSVNDMCSSYTTSPKSETGGSSEFDLGRWLLIAGAASVGAVMVMMMDDRDKAWAMGPGGPLAEEEFWENVRRYALYALTVSTGVIYAVVQPIIQLLRNPISALLVLIIIGGSFFIISQILSAMVGVSDFSYEYAY